MTESALTAAEVATLLNVNVETVYALIRSDGLPAARVGRRWRFSKPKVLAWFEARHVSDLNEPRRMTDSIGRPQ